MLRAAPGTRVMSPAFSKVSTIWWTVGAVTLEMATHVGFGRWAFEDPAIGVDEGQVLALELRKAGPRRWALVK